MNIERDALRMKYWPQRVQVLFVGESPPASGRYFYRGDSGLFRAVREAFVTAFPEWEQRPDFLAAFRDASCALVDLCEEPVDRLAPSERRARCRAAESDLARLITGARPAVLVSLVRTIEPNVSRAVELAHWCGESLALPYPGRWARTRERFVATLAAALSRWEERGLLTLREPAKT